MAGVLRPKDIATDQHLDHQGRVKGLVARPTACIAGMERAKIQTVHCVADEVGQMPRWQPFLQGAGQEVLLIGLVGDGTAAHPCIMRISNNSASGVSLLLPPRLLRWLTSMVAAVRLAGSFEANCLSWLQKNCTGFAQQPVQIVASHDPTLLAKPRSPTWKEGQP